LRPLFRLDPGWLFLITGIVIIAAVVLIPARQDLANTTWELDRASAIRDHRLQRLDRYGQFIDGLRRGDEAVLLSVAALHQNKTSTDRFPLYTPPDPALTSASVFPALEPDPLVVPKKPEQTSLIGRLTVSDRTRLWVIFAGAICMLIGLVPGRGEVDDQPIADDAGGTPEPQPA
jgi:hypothetical protein